MSLCEYKGQRWEKGAPFPTLGKTIYAEDQWGSWLQGLKGHAAHDDMSWVGAGESQEQRVGALQPPSFHGKGNFLELFELL